MSKNESVSHTPAATSQSRLARLLHLLEPTRDANHTLGIEERSGRAAKVGCVAIALTAVSLFGIAEVPPPLRMAAPLIGLSLALPLVLTLWLLAVLPRHARLLASLAALALTAVGAACFARATAAQVVIAYFVPAFLLLLAGDHISD